MIFAIEREWAKSPGWFATLDESDRVRLLADYRVRHTAAPPKTKGKR